MVHFRHEQKNTYPSRVRGRCVLRGRGRHQNPGRLHRPARTGLPHQGRPHPRRLLFGKGDLPVAPARHLQDRLGRQAHQKRRGAGPPRRLRVRRRQDLRRLRDPEQGDAQERQAGTRARVGRRPQRPARGVVRRGARRHRRHRRHGVRGRRSLGTRQARRLLHQAPDERPRRPRQRRPRPRLPDPLRRADDGDGRHGPLSRQLRRHVARDQRPQSPRQGRPGLLRRVRPRPEVGLEMRYAGLLHGQGHGRQHAGMAQGPREQPAADPHRLLRLRQRRVQGRHGSERHKEEK